ncbi:YdgA family protein [Dongia sp. agr-C8]
MLYLESGIHHRIGGKVWRGMAAASLAALLLAGCGDSGAERQKEAAEIAKGIEDYLALIEVPSQPIRIRHDKVTVTPTVEGKGFDVAITGIRYGSEKQVQATFGEIDYRLTPDGADQYQVSDLKMPGEFALNGLDGKPEANVKFTTTAFTATWSKPLQNFLKFDWQAKDIAVNSATDPRETFTVASATITGDGKENGKGLLDQVSTITLNALAGTDPADGTTVKLDKLLGTVTVAQLDFPAYRQMMAKINEFSAKYAPAGEPAPDAALSDEDRKALADLVRGFPKLMAAYGYDFSGEGLTVTDAKGAVTVQLARGGMALGLKGINTDQAQANFSISHDGLAVNDPAFQDPIAKAVLPKKGNLSLLATDIPVPSLVEGVAKALPEMTSGDPQVAQGGQFMMMGALMSALSQSTLKLTIEPSGLETEKAKLSADGALKLALETPQKAVGVVNFALLGLDDLIALAQGMAGQSPDAQQAMGVLSMLQALAQRETGADGKPVDKYKVDLTESGQVLVNGKPLDGIAP